MINQQQNQSSSVLTRTVVVIEELPRKAPKSIFVSNLESFASRSESTSISIEVLSRKSVSIDRNNKGCTPVTILLNN